MIPENQKEDPPVNQGVPRSPPVEVHTGDKTDRLQVRQADQDAVIRITSTLYIEMKRFLISHQILQGCKVEWC